MSNCFSGSSKIFTERRCKQWRSQAPARTCSMTFTTTQKMFLRRLQKRMKRDSKTNSFRKVLSFPVSLIIPHPHSTPYGHPFKTNFRKTPLTSLSDISITYFRQQKTYQNEDYHRHLIALFAPQPKRCFTSLLHGCETYLNEDTILF